MAQTALAYRIAAPSRAEAYAGECKDHAPQVKSARPDGRAGASVIALPGPLCDDAARL